MPWLAEEMLGGQHQRVNIPAHARTTTNSLLQKRLEEDLFWIFPHVPLRFYLVKGLSGLIIILDKENGLLCHRSRLQQNFKMSMNVCPGNIFWTAEPFTTKLGMAMHHHEPDCGSKRFVCYLQGQGYSEGSCNHNMTFLHILWSSDPFATKLGLITCYHKLDCPMNWLDCSVVVKVTGKVANSNKYSSG